MLRMRRLRAAPPFGAALMLVLALSAAPARAQYNPMEIWERFDFTTRAVRPEQIKGMDTEELALLRGIVFGRHGRVFKETAIQQYLRERPWYKPNPRFDNSMLNDVERRTLDVIREAEARSHAQIEPGDLRWWRDRPMSAEMLGEHSASEWRIMIAEVEAIHGKRFDEPWLQDYFEERYWYRPSSSYEPKTLTPLERTNIETMQAAQRKQRNVAISPGDMGFFTNRAISDEMLRGLTLYELRLLRNEIYARKGRLFRTPWIQQYFWAQPWYDPGEDTYDVTLTAVEKLNVDTITAVENRLHEELSAKPVDSRMLGGLFLEDARKLRNEIFARHGRMFKDAWLQGYFSSLPWYKPNPAFSETSLTAVERRNVAAILAYEKTAETELSAVEG